MTTYEDRCLTASALVFLVGCVLAFVLVQPQMAAADDGHGRPTYIVMTRS